MWITVFAKPSKTKSSQKLLVVNDISLEDLIVKISSALSYLKSDIVGCFIYGSRARKTNKSSSDVDLIIFFKQLTNSEELKDIKNDLVKKIGIPIDFVACIYTKKWIEHTDDRDICYFEQIKPDAIQIMGTHDLSYLIETSKKLGKIL